VQYAVDIDTLAKPSQLSSSASFFFPFLSIKMRKLSADINAEKRNRSLNGHQAMEEYASKNISLCNGDW
jgi:hypothetical protein